MKKLLTCLTLLSALLSPDIFCMKKKGNKGDKGSKTNIIETKLKPEDKIIKRIDYKLKEAKELWARNNIKETMQDFVLIYGFEIADKADIAQLLINIGKTAINGKVSIKKLLKAIDTHVASSLFQKLADEKEIDPKNSAEEFAKYRDRFLDGKIKKSFNGDMILASRALDIAFDLISCFLQNLYGRLPD